MLAQATSIVAFMQLIGGIIGLAYVIFQLATLVAHVALFPCSIAGSIFANQLKKNLPIYAAGLSDEMIEGLRQSVTLIKTLPAEMQPGVIKV